MNFMPSVEGGSLPLWQRGIKGDFLKEYLKISPLPLFFKEGNLELVAEWLL